MYGFLTTYVVILLEFEQALKNFLDSKNYRTLTKLLEEEEKWRKKQFHSTTNSKVS